MPSTTRILPLLLLTTLAHAQWQVQNSQTTASLRGIHALSDQLAWASGTEGTVLRTTDGGATWQPCTTPPNAAKLDFRGIQAFDANTAIVMSSGKGDLSRLYKTTDACKTWKLVFTNPDKEGFWDAMKFTDTANGYLLGDPIDRSFRLWRTNNSGDTWRDEPNRTFQADPLAQGAFAASNSALWVASYNPYLAWGSGGTAGAMIYSRSILRLAAGYGQSGNRNPIPLGNKTKSSGVFSISFRDDEQTGSIGVAVGGDYLKPDNDTGTSAQTLNGRNWQPAQTPPHGYRSSVAYEPTTKTWITVGPNGTDISTDDGRNWRPLNPGPQDPADADRNWNALSLPFVVGPKGRIGKLRPEALKPINPKP